jgi:LysM repeat protein
MRRLLFMLLASLACPAFAADEDSVPLKPFRMESAAPARNTYTVAQGDTVSSIARKFGRDPKLIVWLNRLETPDALPVGKVLFIGESPTAAR